MAYLGTQAARLPATSGNEAPAGPKVAPAESLSLSLSLQAAGEPPALPDAAALFFHTVAILHSLIYRTENSGALRQDWPRTPLPANRELLLASAELGKKIAALLDIETPVLGVTAGAILPELKNIAVISHVEGKRLSALP